MSISIAIVTWNRSGKLLRALNSCLNKMEISEVIIVDNNSSDDTDIVVNKFIKSHDLNINFIKLYENLGCPIARNIAIKNCNSEFVYCLDDDGWLDDFTLKKALFLIQHNELIDIVCSKIVDPLSDDIIGLNGDQRCIGKFSAGASLYRRHVFSQVGFFPNYFRQMEESHFALRILDSGREIWFDPSSIMYHEKVKTVNDNINEIRLNYKNDLNNIRDLLGVRYFLILYPFKFISFFKCYFKLGKNVLFLLDSINNFIFVYKPYVNSRYKKNISFKSYLMQRKLN